MSEEFPLSQASSNGSTGKDYLYASRVSRLKIATMIENAESSSRHPYVSIIRGRDMESVNSFAGGVIEILQLHGNTIIYVGKNDTEQNGKTRASSENIVYVIEQSYIEQKAREKGIVFPLTSSALIRALGLNISPTSKVIIKVTSEFSQKIITENSGSPLSAQGQVERISGSARMSFPSTASTLAFYFGAASFASAAIIQAVLLLTQIVGPAFIYQSLSLVNVGIIFFSITLLSYALRYSGYRAMNNYERFITLAGGVFFIAAAIMTYERYGLIHTIIGVANGLKINSVTSGGTFFIPYISAPIAFMTVAQVVLFSIRLKKWVSTVAVAIFASLPLIAPLLLGPRLASYIFVNFGDGFYFLRSSVIPGTYTSIAVSTIFVLADAALAILFTHIGKSGFSSEMSVEDHMDRPSESGA